MQSSSTSEHGRSCRPRATKRGKPVRPTRHLVALALVASLWSFQGHPVSAQGPALDPVTAGSESDVRSGAVSNLLRRAQVERSAGRDRDAATLLDQARNEARALRLPGLQAFASHELGGIAIDAGRFDEGAALLAEAGALAAEAGAPALAAASANALGAALETRGREQEARAHYRIALGQAREAGDAALSAAARLNLATLAEGPSGLTLLREALEDARAVPDPREGGQLTLRLGNRAIDRGALPLARQALELARIRSETAGDAELVTEVLGELGRLELLAGRRQAAVRATEQAIARAPADAHDPRYRLEWRLARIAAETGGPEAALPHFRRAAFSLEQVRPGLAVVDRRGRSLYASTLEPLYSGLADSLLGVAAALPPQSDRRQELLAEVRDSVEQLRLDELRDFYRDACILPLTRGVDDLAPGAAVLYPVILPRRLDLVARVGGRFVLASVAVDRETLGATVAQVRASLIHGGASPEASRDLYRWLVAPIENELAAASVDTLVFSVDGPLRTIPMAALDTGRGYLAEHFAVAMVPGARLLDPEPLRRQSVSALLAGLSRPGPVRDSLPDWWVRAMASRDAVAASTGVTRGVVLQAPARGRGIYAVTDRPPSQVIAADTDLLALPGVSEEIRQIARLLPARVLLDEDFRLDSFARELAERPVSIVHIASHGVFAGRPDDSFVLTYDRKLDMQTLADILRPKELADAPIELLVLSACQTAEGDDRTPLGLAGVALQSGARSALGALWPVDDAATQRLMRELYTLLDDPQLTKAQALRGAQLQLIRDPVLGHPRYWAPFILVGNWL